MATHAHHAPSPGTTQVSDVAAAGSGVGAFAHAKTHDRQWVWKPLNKVYRGQTLITRTIRAATFQATYKELDAASGAPAP